MRAPALFILASLLTLASCSRDKHLTDAGGDRKVAEAFNKALFITDIPGLTATSTKSDSQSVISKYAREWAMNEVFLRKAKDHLSMARQKQIDEKVEKYKWSLYRYEYEKSLIIQKMDTTLNYTELDSFVRQFPANFMLEEDIVRFNLIINPPPSDIGQLRRWIQSSAYEELNEYCSEQKLEYYFGAHSWTPSAKLFGLFPEVPINELPNNEISYLKANGKRYLVQILEYKVQGTPAPTTFMRDEVKSALLQIKKAEFVEEISKEMLQDVVKKKKVKFYP